MLRSTAPENSPKPPKTALKPSFPHCGKSFSIVWKNREIVFPLCGIFAESFSIAWKKWACFSTVWKIFFHSVEKSRKSFPYCGILAGAMSSYRVYVVRYTYIHMHLCFKYACVFHNQVFRRIILNNTHKDPRDGHMCIFQCSDLHSFGRADFYLYRPDNFSAL